MDVGDSSSGGKQGDGGDAGMPWASLGGDAPLPPVFGNANASTGGGDMDFKGINLDDVFSGVFFSPDGDLLEIPSDDEDDALNLTLSSTSISEGGAHPQFAQFAVLGDGSQGQRQKRQLSSSSSSHSSSLITQGLMGQGLLGQGLSGQQPQDLLAPLKMEIEEKKSGGGGEGEGAGTKAGAGAKAGAGTGAGAELKGEGLSVQHPQDLLVPLKMETEEKKSGGGGVGPGAGAAVPAAAAAAGGGGGAGAGGTGGAGAGVTKSELSAGVVSQGGAEVAEAVAAGVASEAAAEEARAAQEMAVSKAAAAVKAAAAHAEAQARMQLGGVGGSSAEKAHPSDLVSPSVGLAGLPTGGISGPLAPHGMGIDPPGQQQQQQVPPPGAPGGGSTGGASASWGRGAFAGAGMAGAGARAGAAPRRQRHKVSSKDLTEEQRIERRERNREHAKRSRVRKKFLLDSLQRSVDALQAENESLKGSIVTSLGERGRELVATCVPEDAGGTLVTANPTQATKILDDPDYSLVKALQTAQQNFVITDASLPDNPIVFASGGFLELTKYKLQEVLGRNCRFLQGPDTDPRAVDKIRKAIEEGLDTSVCLLNYRADGTKFWNQFFVASLRDGGGVTVNYVGVQCKVGDEYARIVVHEQNRQLAAPSAPSRRAGAAAPGTPKQQQQVHQLPPSSGPLAEAAAAAAASAAASAAAAAAASAAASAAAGGAGTGGS